MSQLSTLANIKGVHSDVEFERRWMQSPGHSGCDCSSDGQNNIAQAIVNGIIVYIE